MTQVFLGKSIDHSELLFVYDGVPVILYGYHQGKSYIATWANENPWFWIVCEIMITESKESINLYDAYRSARTLWLVNEKYQWEETTQEYVLDDLLPDKEATIDLF